MPRFTGTCAVTLLLALTGCPGKEDDDSQSGSSTAPSSSSETAPSSSSETEPTTDTVDPTGGPVTTGATDTGSDTDTDTDTDTGTSEFIDLFACGVPEACEPIFWHLDPEPASALECAAQLILSKKPGLVRALETPGPNIDETDYFVFSLGDGTALLQTRERHCDPIDAGCDFDTFPWEPSSAHQICDFVMAEDVVAACGCGMDSCDGCRWDPFFNGLTNCKPVEEFTCMAVLDLLAG